MSVAGNLVQLARLRSGLTQRELAARAKTSAAAIAAYESGRRDPTLETLRRVCRAAGWDLRVRLERPDRYAESLPQVLADYFDPDDVAAWRQREIAAPRP